MNPSFPTQIGYMPSGSSYGSQVVIGKNPTGAWNGIGLGGAGQPDPLSAITVNLTRKPGSTLGSSISNLAIPPAIINLNVDDVLRVMIASDSTAVPKQFNFTFKEVAICEQDAAGNTSERRMVVLASQTYPAPTT